MKEKLIAEFENIFGAGEEAKVYFVPGRVNLIGDHTDYNGGHVFPCALTLGTYGAVRLRKDRTLKFYSMNFPEKGVITSSLDDLTPSEEAAWTNYPKGVMWAFEERGMKLPYGIELLLYGTIPNGSGLSSSASVEVLTGFLLRELFRFAVTNQELAMIGQYAENRFNGVNCGIMDQFAVAMGKKGHAIFLNTDTLEYQYVPLQLLDCHIVITCSNKKRGLADSKYNERRKECETALAEIQQVLGIRTLADLTEELFDIYEVAIRDEDRRKRARHAVYENGRTIRAKEVLLSGDLEEFGRLMNESHRSLSEDYEVTGDEMDTLAEEAWKIPGVVGSRITGGGFGGCTVSIVKEEGIALFKEQVAKVYQAKFGYAPDFYVVEPGGGPLAL